MYNIDLAQAKNIVADIVSKHQVENVAFVGCGASKSELYPAKSMLYIKNPPNLNRLPKKQFIT